MKGQDSHEGIRETNNGARTGDFGISLGSVWVSVSDFGSLEGHFAMIVESLWVYEGPFSKSTHFPYMFELSFKKYGVNFGSLRRHFGVNIGV